MSNSRGRRAAGAHLVNNTERLPEFLNTAEVPVVAIAILPDWYIELDLGRVVGSTKAEHNQTGLATYLIVLVIRGYLPDVPCHTTSAEHDAAKAVVQCLLCGDLSYVDRTGLPDSVSGDDLLDLVHARTELRRPHEDVVQEAMRQVKRDATRANVCRVQTRTRNTFVELHELLAFLETPQEGRQCTHIHRMCQDSHKVYAGGTR